MVVPLRADTSAPGQVTGAGERGVAAPGRWSLARKDRAGAKFVGSKRLAGFGGAALLHNLGAHLRWNSLVGITKEVVPWGSI